LLAAAATCFGSVMFKSILDASMYVFELSAEILKKFIPVFPFKS